MYIKNKLLAGEWYDMFYHPPATHMKLAFPFCPLRLQSDPVRSFWRSFWWTRNVWWIFPNLPPTLEHQSWVNLNWILLATGQSSRVLHYLFQVYGPLTLFRIVAKFLSFAKRSHPVCNDSDSRSTWRCPGTPIPQDLVQGKRPTNTDVWVDWVLKPKNNCILNDQRWNESLLQVLHWYLCKNIQLYLQFAPHLFLWAFNPLMPGCQPPPALTVSCWRLPNAAWSATTSGIPPIGVLLLEDLETEPPTLSIPIMRFMRSTEMIIQNDKMVSNKSWYEHILLCICIIS